MTIFNFQSKYNYVSLRLDVYWILKPRQPFLHIFIPLLMLIPALRHHGPQKEVGRPPFLKLGLFEEAEASGRHRRKLSGDVWSRILQRDGDAIKMGPPGDGVSAQPDPVASTSFHGLPAAPPTAGFQKVIRKKGPKIPRKKATLLKTTGQDQRQRQNIKNGMRCEDYYSVGKKRGLIRLWVLRPITRHAVALSLENAWSIAGFQRTSTILTLCG